MKFQAFGILNEKEMKLYTFKTKELADKARTSLKEFDNHYEQYSLNVEVKKTGEVFISDKGIEDLENQLLLQKLNPEILKLNDEDLKNKMLEQFSIIKNDLGFKFNFEEIKELDSKVEFGM